MKIYLAAPLFSIAQKRFNKKLKKHLEKIDNNLEVYLPQDYTNDDKYQIYLTCIMEIDNADLVLAILDGPDADSGTAFELGYAYGQDKNIIGVRTDPRELECFGTNLMLYYTCDKYIKCSSDVQTLAKKIYNEMQNLLKEYL